MTPKKPLQQGQRPFRIGPFGRVEDFLAFLITMAAPLLLAFLILMFATV